MISKDDMMMTRCCGRWGAGAVQLRGLTGRAGLEVVVVVTPQPCAHAFPPLILSPCLPCSLLSSSHLPATLPPPFRPLPATSLPLIVYRLPLP